MFMMCPLQDWWQLRTASLGGVGHHWAHRGLCRSSQHINDDFMDTFLDVVALCFRCRVELLATLGM